LVGERHEAEQDERHAENRCWFHGQFLSREAIQPANSSHGLYKSHSV
jgi:hypothetical protein